MGSDNSQVRESLEGDRMKAKVEIKNQAQNQALEEVLFIFEDKRLVRAVPHGPDRVELVKTIMNRARDLEREAQRVDIATTHKEPDMTKYDGVNEIWRGCPFCDNTDITHVGANGRPSWQGCKKCQVFLNSDGSMGQMGGRR